MGPRVRDSGSVSGMSGMSGWVGETILVYYNLKSCCEAWSFLP